MFINMKGWTKIGNIFNKHHSQLPVVDNLEDCFRVYYSTRDSQGRSIPMFIDFNKSDFKTKREPTKINLSLGRPGMFDWSGIMPTEIITLENGFKYLYYIGWSRRLDVPYHNNLGLAISEDGIKWEKYSDGPIFHTSSEEPGYIGTVGILVEDNIWKMWYLSCRDWIEHNGVMEPIYDIKYAISEDGIKWSTTNLTSIPLVGDEGGISAARIIKDDKYYMYFSVRNKINYRENSEDSYRIKMAVSEDGINWNRLNDNVIDISDDGWDNFMVCYPYLIRNDNQMLMFYNGNGFGKSGIGVCENIYK